MADTILLVEDDPSILQGLEMNLGLEGFRTIAARDGEEALAHARTHKPNLILLDLMLPKVSGIDVLRRIRAEDQEIPIVVLSARDQESDKVLALSLAADDYMVKPFSLAELVARIRGALRRHRLGLGESARDPQFGAVKLDVSGRRVVVDGREIEATAREFDLLLFLYQHPGIAFSREQLMQQVWGVAHYGTLRTIDNFIARLRSKVESDPDHPVHIETVRGVGYRFRR
jgi:DNA-binding response OmpR family regulator